MTAPVQLEKGDWVRFSKTAPEPVNRFGEPDIGQIGEYCGVMHHRKDGDHSILIKWENESPHDTFTYDWVCRRSQVRKIPGRAK